jgi:hypothetical protein
MAKGEWQTTKKSCVRRSPCAESWQTGHCGRESGTGQLRGRHVAMARPFRGRNMNGITPIEKPEIHDREGLHHGIHRAGHSNGGRVRQAPPKFQAANSKRPGSSRRRSRGTCGPVGCGMPPAGPSVTANAFGVTPRGPSSSSDWCGRLSS